MKYWLHFLTLLNVILLISTIIAIKYNHDIGADKVLITLSAALIGTLVDALKRWFD